MKKPPLGMKNTFRVSNAIAASFIVAAAATPFFAHDKAEAEKQLPTIYGITPTSIGAKSYTDYPFLKCKTSTYGTKFEGTVNGQPVEGAFCSGPFLKSTSVEYTVKGSNPQIKITQSFKPR